MKGWRFYQRTKRFSKQVDEADVELIAVDVDSLDEDAYHCYQWRSWHSPVSSIVGTGGLKYAYRRISEARARELAPKLFEVIP